MPANVKKDYRNTDRCPVLEDVAAKKVSLEQRIRKEQPRVKIIYNSVRDRTRPYFRCLAEMYNYKCAYCGTTLNFLDNRLFEVDHFICESSFSNDTNGRAEAGKVINLVFSCYSCNRGKSDLHIESSHQILLNPDDNSIAKVFVRDDDYYVKIADAYSTDAFVKLFYDKLMLGSETRRLDFLLLEMKALIFRMQDKNRDIADKLEQCLSRLIQKKNCTSA